MKLKPHTEIYSYRIISSNILGGNLHIVKISGVKMLLTQNT